MKKSQPTSAPSNEQRSLLMADANSWNLSAFDIAASMGEIYAAGTTAWDTTSILTETCHRIRHVVDFLAIAFVSVRNGQPGEVLHGDPEEFSLLVESEISHHVQSGTFSRALREPVLAPAKNEKHVVMFHAMAARDRVIGMFVGVLDESKASSADNVLDVLSILLSSATNAIDHASLNCKIVEHNRNLESLLHDRTVDLEKALSAVKKANASRSLFLANMSHEIRTPMNSVLGLAELLLDSELNAEQRDFLETIHSSGELLLTIINDVLDCSAIETNKMSLQITECDVRKTIEDAVNMLSRNAKQKGIEILRIVQHDVPLIVLGDPVRLRQIISNLISNAVKFTERGDVIVRCSVERNSNGTKETETTLRFSIADTGIGILPEIQPQLFQSFSVADASTTRSYSGSGLGLAISKHLAEMMRGEIGVESALGKGSTFWFTVVVGQTDPRHRSEKKPYKELCILPAGLSVLLVEDNLVNQKVALKMLEKLGCRPDLANNGKEAVDAVRTTPYDIVLMDCMMPELDGFDATKIIRGFGSVIVQPSIIALTAGVLPSERDRCYEVGMDDHLAKPIKIDALFEVITKWIKGNDIPAIKYEAVEPVVVKKAGATPLLLLDQKRRKELQNLSNGDDSLLVELGEMFLREGPARICALREAFNTKDENALHMISHTLKGSSRNIGATRLADYCQIIEQGANTESMSSISSVIEAIEHEFIGVQRAFNDYTKTEREVI